jgi:hypothetical protein
MSDETVARPGKQSGTEVPQKMQAQGACVVQLFRISEEPITHRDGGDR